MNNKLCLIGNERLFKSNSIKLPLIDKIKDKLTSSTVICTYYDCKFIGTLLIQDTPHERMKNIIQWI